jgi:hypothetical protein
LLSCHENRVLSALYILTLDYFYLLIFKEFWIKHCPYFHSMNRDDIGRKFQKVRAVFSGIHLFI